MKSDEECDSSRTGRAVIVPDASALVELLLDTPTGHNFPAEYKGSALATMHGSWNLDKRTGYKVVRLLFDGAGNPQANMRIS